MESKILYFGTSGAINTDATQYEQHSTTTLHS